MKTEIKLSNILIDYKLDHLTLDEAENKILLLFSVSGRSEQLVCPACNSQVIVSDERHNIKMCGVCKTQWAN
jgi:hypothetical protein